MTVFFALLAAGYAQDLDDADVVVPERTEIDFETVRVAGQLVRPSGQLVNGLPTLTFGNLIPMRGTFDPEILRSLQSVN